MEEKDKTIQEQQKIIDDMKDGFRQIGDYSDALKNVLGYLLEGVSEGVLVTLTLSEIAKIVDQNI